MLRSADRLQSQLFLFWIMTRNLAITSMPLPGPWLLYLQQYTTQPPIPLSSLRLFAFPGRKKMHHPVVTRDLPNPQCIVRTLSNCKCAPLKNLKQLTRLACFPPSNTPQDCKNHRIASTTPSRMSHPFETNSEVPPTPGSSAPQTSRTECRRQTPTGSRFPLEGCKRMAGGRLIREQKATSCRSEERKTPADGNRLSRKLG